MHMYTDTSGNLESTAQDSIVSSDDTSFAAYMSRGLPAPSTAELMDDHNSLKLSRKASTATCISETKHDSTITHDADTAAGRDSEACVSKTGHQSEEVSLDDEAGSKTQSTATTSTESSESDDAKVDEERRKESRSELFRQLQRTCGHYEKKFLDCWLNPSDHKGTSFEDIGIEESVRETLSDLITLPARIPEAFGYGILQGHRIFGALLYGPPGTGKTLLAKVLASQTGINTLLLSGSDIMESCVGESEKGVRGLFSLARKLSPCVVFLDEADGLLARRKGSDKQWQRTQLNEFLGQWDGMAKEPGKGPFFLLATNRPSDLDTAVLRRVPVRIFLDLPNMHMRARILQILLRGEDSSGIDLAEIAKRTPGFSGSDLKNLCVSAALNCLREDQARAGTHGKLPKRKLERRHFQQAMVIIKGTPIEPEALAKLRSFQQGN